MYEKVTVSICCLTYNHEKYIIQALDSFLKQKTNFQYEILIHDDASTDGTVDIIREYKKRYPNIIKPIFQKENQYSKGVMINWKYQYPRAKGKYIAFCEGDDFWCDVNKLQMQYDLMEQHPEYSMCVHSSDLANDDGETIGKIRGWEDDRVVELEDYLVKKYEQSNLCFQTSSFFVRKELIIDMTKDQPAFVVNAPVGDLPLALYMAYRGDIFYINKIMSTYRTAMPHSWTSTVEKDRLKNIEHNKEILKMYVAFNEYSNNCFKDATAVAIRNIEYSIAENSYDYWTMVKRKYRDLLNKNSAKIKLFIYLSAYVPGFNKTYRIIKGR